MRRVINKMIKHCITCGKEYETYDPNKSGNIKGGKMKKYKRGRNTITCSKKCSWVYNNFTREERKELKEIQKEKYKNNEN